MEKQEEKRESFLDKNTLIAVVMVCVAWLSWDAYMRKKYPKKTEKTNIEQSSTLTQKSSEVEDPKSARVGAGGATPKSTRGTGPRGGPLGQRQKKEKLFPVKTRDLAFEISSQGMGLKNLSLNKILDREGNPILLFSEASSFLQGSKTLNLQGSKTLNLQGSKTPFETRIKGQEDTPLFFKVEQTGEYIFKGKAQVGGSVIEKTLSIAPSGFLIESEIKIRNRTASLSRGAFPIAGVSSFLVQTEKKEQKKSGFLSLFLQPDFLSFFVSSSKGEQSFPIMSKEESEKKELRSHSFSLVKSVAVGSKYFGQAWIENKSDVFPDFRISFENSQPVGVLTHSVLNTKKELLVSFKMFIGPKDIPLLKKEQAKLVHWVDFGWFGSLSRFILKILELFYTLSGNWGVSIVFLTILVRILLLPAVVSSHRSMEIMKKVQPEIQKVRKKFKKDPQRMNQEVMALMKAHRANPLGGCLPMLLQIPVFWSLVEGSYLTATLFTDRPLLYGLRT